MKLKPIVLGVAVVIGLGVSGTAAAGGGGGRTSWKTVRVRIQPTNIVNTDLGKVCDTGGQCVYSSRATDVVQTGDAQGSTVQAEVAAVVGTTATTSSLGTFTGSVTGCGTGGFQYSGRGTIDLVTGSADVYYLITPGSGTGDLTGLTGVLEQHVAAGASADVPPITGVLRCAVRR